MSPAAAASAEEERLRPLYARALRLRHVDPSGMLCFVFFEGTVAFGLLLALAELVNWWGVLVLPATVAVMVKINDVVAAAVVRSAARVPVQERERFRREIQPVVGRASVPRQSLVQPGRSGEPTTAPDPTGRDPAPARPAAGDPRRSVGDDSAGTRAGAPGKGGRSSVRFIPVTRPLSMTALLRARLEGDDRRRPRPVQEWIPRPLGLSAPVRLRLQDAEGPAAGGISAPSIRDSRSAPSRSGREPDTDRAGDPAGAADRTAGGTAAAESPKGAAGRRYGVPRIQQPELPSGAEPLAVGRGRPSNSRLGERLDRRPVRRWLDRLDPIDTIRQRARQSARRRYE